MKFLKEYMRDVHFTMSMKKSSVDKLKKMARIKSVESDRIVSVSELIRNAIIATYPELFEDSDEAKQERLS